MHAKYVPCGDLQQHSERYHSSNPQVMQCLTSFLYLYNRNGLLQRFSYQSIIFEHDQHLLLPSKAMLIQYHCLFAEDCMTLDVSPVDVHTLDIRGP